MKRNASTWPKISCKTPTANITLKGKRLNALLPKIRNKETNEPSKWAKGSSRRHQSRWWGGKAAREKVSSSPRKCVSKPHRALYPHLSERPFLFYLKISAPQEILSTSDLTWKTHPTLQMNSFYFPSESSTSCLTSSFATLGMKEETSTPINSALFVTRQVRVWWGWGKVRENLLGGWAPVPSLCPDFRGYLVWLWSCPSCASPDPSDSALVPISLSSSLGPPGPSCLILPHHPLQTLGLSHSS